MLRPWEVIKKFLENRICVEDCPTCSLCRTMIGECEKCNKILKHYYEEDANK